MNEELVRKWFIGFVNSHEFASPELKRSLLAQKQIINDYTRLLFKELQKCESTLAVKKGRVLKVDTYKEFVKDMAHGFVMAIEKKANENIQSDIKRLSVQAEKQKQQDFDKTFNGQASGELGEYVNEGSLILDENYLKRPTSKSTNQKPKF